HALIRRHPEHATLRHTPNSILVLPLASRRISTSQETHVNLRETYVNLRRRDLLQGGLPKVGDGERKRQDVCGVSPVILLFDKMPLEVHLRTELTNGVHLYVGRVLPVD